MTTNSSSVSQDVQEILAHSSKLCTNLRATFQQAAQDADALKRLQEADFSLHIDAAPRWSAQGALLLNQNGVVVPMVDVSRAICTKTVSTFILKASFEGLKTLATNPTVGFIEGHPLKDAGMPTLAIASAPALAFTPS